MNLLAITSSKRSAITSIRVGCLIQYRNKLDATAILDFVSVHAPRRAPWREVQKIELGVVGWCDSRWICATRSRNNKFDNKLFQTTSLRYNLLIKYSNILPQKSSQAFFHSSSSLSLSPWVNIQHKRGRSGRSAGID